MATVSLNLVRFSRVTHNACRLLGLAWEQCGFDTCGFPESMAQLGSRRELRASSRGTADPVLCNGAVLDIVRVTMCDAWWAVQGWQKLTMPQRQKGTGGSIATREGLLRSQSCLI